MVSDQLDQYFQRKKVISEPLIHSACYVNQTLSTRQSLDKVMQLCTVWNQSDVGGELFPVTPEQVTYSENKVGLTIYTSQLNFIIIWDLLWSQRCSRWSPRSLDLCLVAKQHTRVFLLPFKNNTSVKLKWSAEFELIIQLFLCLLKYIIFIFWRFYY